MRTPTHTPIEQNFLRIRIFCAVDGRSGESSSSGEISGSILAPDIIFCDATRDSGRGSEFLGVAAKQKGRRRADEQRDQARGETSSVLIYSGRQDSDTAVAAPTLETPNCKLCCTRHWSPP